MLVAGSIAPWMEGILLSEGAAHTTTTDYNAPVSEHPSLCATVSQAELLASGDSWPYVVPFSSLEHDGQVRYGGSLRV